MSARSAGDRKQVDIRAADPAHAQAFGDGKGRKSRDVLDAAKAFLLDGGDEPAVTDENSGDIAVVRVQAKDVHGIEAASAARVRRPMAFLNRI
jgi:hypothetical protein